ncbi:MAG TPA: UDP-N-acetylmuramate--L-alanine ligase [Candidatus Acidoferrales bacterium]|nr:UDP-N-acetylmuramate--L-alanine ligase [Candidatus Acidoferrales bacterium]
MSGILPAALLQQAWMRRVRRIHFVGMGGVGMAGIAEVLLNLGYQISGSDVRDNAALQRLAALGAVVMLGHDADQVTGADVVVVSSAIGADNPEVAAARAQGTPVIPRAQMLAELMRFRYGIAVAGTHGKTTTTSLIASVLADGNLDPTFVIGGRLNQAGTHARLGSGPYLVAEADESDASFMHLQPMITVVTNVDADHLDTYGGSFDRLRQTFLEFLHNLPFYGLAVICADDPTLAAMRSEIGRPVLTYGFAEDADVRVLAADPAAGRNHLQVRFADGGEHALTLNLPGRHNILNALAALTVGHELGVAPAGMARTLEQFQGIGRRFQRYGALAAPTGRVELVDDYGHHPTELEATLAAARETWPEARLVVAFQPHRYSRTRDLLEDFARVLSGADVLLLTEVYAAGEAPITQADGRALARAIRAWGRLEPVFVPTVESLPEALEGLLQPGDVLLTLGAGDIGTLPARLRQRWEEAP